MKMIVEGPSSKPANSISCFTKFVFRSSVACNFAGVRVQLPLGWNTCLPINFDIEKFWWKTCEVEKGSIILLFFSCGRAFNVAGWGLVRLVLYTSLQLQIPCTCNLPTLHIYSTSSRRCVWDPLEPLRWSFFCRNSQRVRAVSYFCKRAPSCTFDRMFYRILYATLPNNLL